MDGGTKPLCGVSLEGSSSPQRRKRTSQITYNSFVRQSDVRTPNMILAVTAPRDSCYKRPHGAEGSASPSHLYWRVWLGAVTGCGYPSTIQPQAAPIYCTSAHAIIIQTEEPRSAAGSSAFTSQFSSSGKKTTTQSRMGHATVPS